MKLFGTFVSPFARRVAVSLNVLGLPYESVPLAASKQPEEVRKYNPLTRVPALMLESGETLIESSAILDEIDQIVGPERALIPACGPARRQVLKTVSVGAGCADKSVWAYYEVTKRPLEKVHQPWLEHNEAQVLAGYAYLEDQLKQSGVEALFRNGATLNQAGITCAVAFRFTAFVRPKLDIVGTAPTLAAFSEECEATDAFISTSID
jgi:glutathione S-transferase